MVTITQPVKTTAATVHNVVYMGGTRFSELRESGSSGCRFTAATLLTLFIHTKSWDLREFHGSSCWMLESGSLDPPARSRPC